jgi:uncharacterized membrane protein YphA (DoxX/SURF4 family)
MILKRATDVSRYLVGGLFIFSGMIKINDPVGTAIKLEEYFEVFAGDIAEFFSLFSPFSLPLAVTLNVLEVALGIALIMRFRTRITLWALLLLIVFFTFLTFYSAYFNKVTDCGCFGDAIKLTPWESFYKDIILLGLIGYMFAVRKRITDNSFATSGVIVLSVTMISFFLAIYAIRHEPFIDFRAYKVGTDLNKAIVAEEAPIFEYVFEKAGEQVTSRQYLSEAEGYQLISHRIINEDKSNPKIANYNLWSDEGDFTEESLQGTKLYVIVHSVSKTNTKAFADINRLMSTLPSSGEVVMLTSSSAQEVLQLRAETGFKAPFYYGDATLLKTIIRGNPGLILLREGVVLGKWHYNDVPSVLEVREKLQ